MSVRKRRKSQWRPVTRQVRSFVGWAMHRCAICKSPLAKNYILFGTASRLCRMLLLESLVIHTFNACTRLNAILSSSRTFNIFIWIVWSKCKLFLHVHFFLYYDVYSKFWKSFSNRNWMTKATWIKIISRFYFQNKWNRINFSIFN